MEDPFATPVSHGPIEVLSDSPKDVRKKLETYLNETQQRIELAAQIGKSLLQQQDDLRAKMTELDQEKGDQLRPELRRKLADLAREFNDVEQESTRALLMSAKPAVFLGKENIGSAVLSASGSVSPSKQSVSRRAKNANTKQGDAELATEIAQSLLEEVRHLKNQLFEKEEQLREANAYRQANDQQVESMQNRLKNMEDAEDENWNLEVQNQELRAQLNDTVSSLSRANAEQSRLSKLLESHMQTVDSLKAAENDLEDTMSALQTRHEVDVSGFKIALSDLQRENDLNDQKVELLTAELESRPKTAERLYDPIEDLELDEIDLAESVEPHTPNHSPSASPIKGTPSRHGQLESETMKASLAHARRIIMTLKASLQKERTEKAVLQRSMAENRSASDRSHRNGHQTGKGKLKKESHPRRGNNLVGASRRPNSQIDVFDPETSDWEDDAFETADTEAFETANDQTATETEAYRTGEESPTADSSDETETESTPFRHLPGRRLRSEFTEDSDSEISPASRTLRVRTSRGDMHRRPDSTMMLNTPKALYDEMGALSSSRASSVDRELVPAVQPTVVNAQTSPMADRGGFGDAIASYLVSMAAALHLSEVEMLLDLAPTVSSTTDQANYVAAVPAGETKINGVESASNENTQDTSDIPEDDFVGYSGINHHFHSAPSSRNIVRSGTIVPVEVFSVPPTILAAAHGDPQKHSNDDFPAGPDLGGSSAACLDSREPASKGLEVNNRFEDERLEYRTEIDRLQESVSTLRIQLDEAKSSAERTAQFTPSPKGKIIPPLPISQLEASRPAEKSPSKFSRQDMDVDTMPAPLYPSRSKDSQKIRATSLQRTRSAGSSTKALRLAAKQPDATEISRDSSLSSFKSELDDRFHLNQDLNTNSAPKEPKINPTLVKAVTQTMIGEYLWKYTRRPASSNLSGNRHRRFFWIHPYTRTIYWSVRDPAASANGESKAKSATIEAVRVIADGNISPPGLHENSIVVVTPRRILKFTAPTTHRHETWFTALEYLLDRTRSADRENAMPTDDYTIASLSSVAENNNKDVFCVPVRGITGSQSMSSYHTARGTSSPTKINMNVQDSPRRQSSRPIERVSQIFQPLNAQGITSFHRSQSSRSKASTQDSELTVGEFAHDRNRPLLENENMMLVPFTDIVDELDVGKTDDCGV